jgi:hypothetical protein
MPKGARRRPERLAEKLCHIRHRLELTQEELKNGLSSSALSASGSRGRFGL